jgi:hypothetical protein
MSLREAAQQALEAKQVPLIELLESVPADARMVYEHGQFHSQNIPVGRLCHEAVAALRTALAEPERKPLTDEEIEAIRQVDDCREDAPEFTRIFRIAERAHGIGGEE